MAGINSSSQTPARRLSVMGKSERDRIRGAIVGTGHIALTNVPNIVDLEGGWG
jgi:hypothetical protein